eukprot:83011-Chlamydomonas_euryale.AAC.1
MTCAGKQLGSSAPLTGRNMAGNRKQLGDGGVGRSSWPIDGCTTNLPAGPPGPSMDAPQTPAAQAQCPADTSCWTRTTLLEPLRSAVAGTS